MRKFDGFPFARRLLSLATACVLLALFVGAAVAEEVPRIGKEELRDRLGMPDLVIVDVRSGSDWKGSEFKLPGAFHGDPEDVASWMNEIDKSKEIVLYCA